MNHSEMHIFFFVCVCVFLMKNKNKTVGAKKPNFFDLRIVVNIMLRFFSSASLTFLIRLNLKRGLFECM